MFNLIEFILSLTDLGMCTSHLYPELFEQPTLIVLDVLVAVSHCCLILRHVRRRPK